MLASLLSYFFDKSNFGRNLFKDTLVYGLTDFIFKFINFAIFPLLAYVLSVAEFGIYALLTTFALLIAALFNCGLNRSLERFYLDRHAEKSHQSAVVSMGLFLEAVLALSFICPGVWLIYSMRDALSSSYQIEWTAFALALLGCLPTQLFNLSLNALRLNFLPWHFTMLNILQNSISLAMSLYFVIGLQWGVTGFLGGMAIGYSCIFPLAIFQLYRHLKWIWDWNLAKSMLKFGYPFIFIDLARWIFTSIDRWMLVEFASTREVGLYSMAFKLSTILIFMISAFSLAWTPHALKAANEDPNHRTLFSRCLTLWFFSLTLVAMGINFFGGECLMLLTPPSYWAATALLPYVSTGLALFGTTYVTVIGMMISKKTHHLTHVAWVVAACNIALNLWWAPLFGASGSAAATLITYSLLSGYYFFQAQRIYPLPLEYRKLIFCATLLFSSALSAAVFNTFSWNYSLFFIKLGCFFFALLLYFLISYKNLAKIGIAKSTYS